MIKTQQTKTIRVLPQLPQFYQKDLQILIANNLLNDEILHVLPGDWEQDTDDPVLFFLFIIVLEDLDSILGHIYFSLIMIESLLF